MGPSYSCANWRVRRIFLDFGLCKADMIYASFQNSCYAFILTDLKCIFLVG